MQTPDPLPPTLPQYPNANAARSSSLPPSHALPEVPPIASQPPIAPLYLDPPNSPLAVSSLILGILGFIALPLIGSIAAVVLGHMARNEIKRANGNVGGNGLATIGLVLGYIGLGIAALLVIGIIALLILGAVLLNKSSTTLI